MIFQDVRRQVNLLKNSLSSSSRHIIFKIIVILFPLYMSLISDSTYSTTIITELARYAIKGLALD
jgi:hypothetical protein